MNFKDFNDENNYWPIRTLKELSKYPHINKTWLGYGHTYSSDECYSANNRFCGVILLDSLCLSDDFMNIVSSDKNVRILSAIPLYKEELEFKSINGTNELIKKFEEFSIKEIVDVNRRNVCED